MYIRNILISRLIPAALCLLALAGCESILPEPHKIDIQQGNAIDEEQFEQLYVGMTQGEVMQILGPPVIQSPFRSDRWDYIYRFKPGKGRLRQSRLTLYFEDGVVTQIDDAEYREY